MKKLLFLFIAIIIFCSSSFAQKAIEEAVEWSGAIPFPANHMKKKYSVGTGLIFERPTPNQDGSVSASALTVYILLDNGTVTSVTPDRVEQKPSGNNIFPGATNFNAVFNKKVILDEKGQETEFYVRPIKVTFHRFWERTFNGEELFIQYITL